jgi:iron complex outermembrane recepter protein
MVFFAARYRCLQWQAVSVGFLTAVFAGQMALADTAADAASDDQQAVEKPAEKTNDKLSEIVVTGSRIHRDASDTTTTAPLIEVDAQALTDRGYTQVGDALNQITSNTAQFALTPHDGSSSGSGQQFPNLFNLGAGRTLTLVDGRRFVTSGVATPPTTGVVNTGDNVVDTNMIPTGLLDHVEVAQAGGSVVYGSDAIAGVVNYILKDHFTGATFDAQYGITGHSDYPQDSLRATIGSNFFEDKGNVAIDVEWSRSDPLLQSARTEPALSAIPDANPLYNGPNTSGIVPSVYLQGARFWEFNNNGVLFAGPPGAPYQAAFGGGFFITQNGIHFPGGTPTQFNAAGTGLIPFNPGTFPPGTGPNQAFVVPPFASGGDGYPYQDLGSLFSGVERFNTTVLGHIDLTPDIKVSTELTYGRTTGTDPLYSQASFTVLNDAASGVGAIPVLASNPYLPASATGAIANYLNTTFGGGLGYAWLGGAPIPGLVGLSKNWPNLLPSTAGVTDTDTLRGLVALDGHFSVDSKEYFWEVSASRGYTENAFQYDNVVVNRFNNAINPALNGAGQIVCAINTPTVTDPACIPLNPFGSQPISPAAQNYVSGLFGQTQHEKEDDILATFGGPIFTLPGGALKFNSAFEHRADSADFDPTLDTSLGLGPSGTPTAATTGEYKANEFSTELLIPLLGKDFTLPGVKELELNGAYRHVDNSIAGSANLWDAGLRWTIVSGFTLRASRGTNFRAPNLDQLFASATTALGAVGEDPCDTRSINSGPNPAVRLANCQALFAAHPGYNGGQGLAGYLDPAVNFATAAITSGGDQHLANEISHTTTYGFVLQPEFLPGFTFVADRIEINLTNAITAFSPANYVDACFDVSPQPKAICSTFTRDANGDIVAATSSFLNAGSQVYRGETYSINYHFLAGDMSRIELNLETTHNDVNNLSVTDGSLVQTAGTALDPRWVSRFDASWNYRLLRLTYSLFYLPSALAAPGDNAANTQYPRYASNAQHSLSGQYQVTPQITVRAGIINLTNEEPSYPSINYGDILGRRFFLGANAHF